MTLKQIASLGRKLASFLALFADCFGRCDARELLRVYVKGQLSNLKRRRHPHPSPSISGNHSRCQHPHHGHGGPLLRWLSPH